MKITRVLPLAAILAISFASGFRPSDAQTAASPAEGAYTAAQAAAGEKLYAANCSACHGATLTGGVWPSLVGDAFTSPDPGLAMWLDPARKQLVALRWGTDNAFSADPPSFLAQDSTGVAPDALPAGGTATYTGAAGLVIAQGAAAFVTDRTYADVSIRATFQAGQAPFIVLRDDQGAAHVIDDTCCAGLLSAQGPAPSVDVERTGGTVTCAVDGAAPSTCSAGLSARARVSVGVQGAVPTTPSVVSEIVVKRLGAP